MRWQKKLYAVRPQSPVYICKFISIPSMLFRIRDFNEIAMLKVKYKRTLSLILRKFKAKLKKFIPQNLNGTDLILIFRKEREEFKRIYPKRCT